ncbi:hypothetical protein [Bradyrhizobium sp. Leo121]|uniref:hypothetical protein n=1 Tax=Bradyrhizobium sp. Leo121 TaxID=1571195 RepID=UPI0010294EAA|nr:hypothetical protein [Bradyrhizobium sp. Leo121]RZN31707.1 hypothetical protein CWO90_15890 [Bradyrhizobium sp. Leo121]
MTTESIPCNPICRNSRERRSAPEVTEALDLGDVTLFERRSGDAHVAQMEAALLARSGTGGSFALTGKADTMQPLRQALKRARFRASASPARRIGRR